jgi:hypothetical protein
MYITIEHCPTVYHHDATYWLAEAKTADMLWNSDK